MEVVEEDDVSDEALLKASKTRKGSGAPPSTAGKDLMMGGGADDSYGEYFPDTFEGYSKALQLGPDEDDEQGIVRSKEAEEEDPGGAAGKKAGSKRGGPDVEALKQKAKEDRELKAIEKLMEERRQKRQKRDEGGASGGDGPET